MQKRRTIVGISGATGANGYMLIPHGWNRNWQSNYTRQRKIEFVLPLFH